ncbi:MAG: SdrD B-like domain-containing protein, partial [Bacteroidota bacterium]
MLQRLLLRSVILLLFSGGMLRAQTDVIMQGYYWNSNPGDLTTNQGGIWWDTLASVAPILRDAGFKTVWTPPANKGFAGRFDMGFGLYDYYDFGEFDQKGTIRTRHGDAQQFRDMMDSLHANGLLVMADVVLNHRAGAEEQQPEDCDGGDGVLDLRFTKFRPASGRMDMNAWDFHPNFQACNLDPPYRNRVFFEDLSYFNFLNQELDPNLPNNGWYFGPHNLGRVGDSLIVWGRYLLDEVGFDELRLDAVKHVEPGFISPFLVEMANGNQPFAVGEFFDGNLGALKGYQGEVETFANNFGPSAGSNPKEANMALFDFNLRFALRDMANNGGGGYNMGNLNSAGLKFNPAGGLDGEDIVTFIENHDTDRVGYRESQNGNVDLQVGNTSLELFTDSGHDPVFQDKHMAYAYIMAAEGRPTVFWKDYFWFGLDEELKWQMAMRSATAKGGSLPMVALNAFFTQLNDQDFFVMTRSGTGSNQDGAVFAINDNQFSQGSAFVNTPYSNLEMKDYSDAFLFIQTQVFADGRSEVRANGRNYAWWAPTGIYPTPPDEVASSFTLGNHQGAKLHFLTLNASNASSFIVNGAPIQPGDQVAITPQGNTTAVGLGRVGQSFEWDGVHDMIIEVLGGANAFEAKGGLQNGQSFDVWVFDKSLNQQVLAGSVTFANNGTNFSFSADRPGSRGGSSPFGLTTNAEGTYSVGGISQITAFNADCTGPNDPNIAMSGNSIAIPNGATGFSTNDGRDVGTVSLGLSGNAIFTIDNSTGGGDLNISQIASSNPAFSINIIPNVIFAGGSGVFAVSFAPTTEGVQTTTIRIESDDCNEGSYTFDVTGNGQCRVPTFASQVTEVSCIGGSDGAIELTGVADGNAPFSYSLDGGTTFQSSNVFTGLTAGSYTAKVQDALGCTSADLIVTVGVGVDQTPPVINCQNVSLELDANAEAVLQVGDALVSASDNCGDSASFIYTLSQENFDCNDLGVQDVVLSVADLGGQVSTCTLQVAILGNNLPDVDNDQIPDCADPINNDLAGIQAKVFDDQNGDGIQGSNEPGISGVVVKLLRSNNSKIKQTQTDANGIASFFNLADGQQVKLEFVRPSNHAFALKDQGTNDGKDSDASTSNGRTALFTTVAGQIIQNVDAGLLAPGTVEAFVWDDRNGDGIQGSNEPGIPNVVVKLLRE